MRFILLFTLFLSACSFNADISATKSDFAGEAKAEEAAITWTWINQLDVALEYTSMTLQIYSGDSCSGSAIYTENITSMDGSNVYTPSTYGDYSFNILTLLKDGGTDLSPCLADATYGSSTPIFTVDTEQTTHIFTAFDDFSKTFTGTCSPDGATITSSVGVASSTVCSGGSWSMSLSLYSEAAGSYTSKFTATQNSLTYSMDLALIKTSATLGGSITSPGVYTTTLSPTFTLLSPTASEMKLSNSSDCSGTWETLSLTKAWTLANSNATNTVYVMFRDSVGAYSACSSDTITHDGSAPSAPGSLDDEISTTSITTSTTFTWTSSTDIGTGLDHYEIAIGTTSGGTQILAYTDIGTVLTYQATGLTLTSGTTYYVSLRAVDVAGNTTTVTSDGWDSVLQLNAPTGLTLLEAETSLTASPDISFSYSATGNTSAISDYEYSLGTTSGGTDIRTWTSIATATTFQATGLTLSVNTNYFVNVRAKDALANTSSVVTGQWRVVNTSAVSARYASAANWNDYVKKSATTTACQTTDTYYYNCIHGGEKKEISVTGENSCTGMTAYDTLGVFDWICQAGTPVKMVSIEVKTGKGLKDLVNATSWKSNRVIVKKSGVPVIASNSATWWSNTVEALPSSTSGQTTLSTASRVYTVSTSQLTRGYYINANKVAIVTLGDAKLTLDPAGSANSDGFGSTGSSYYLMFLNSTNMHTWLEGYFVGGYEASGTNSYFTRSSLYYFNVVNNSSIEDFRYGFDYGPSKTLIKSVRAIRNSYFIYNADNYYILKDSSLQNKVYTIYNGSSNQYSYLIGNFIADGPSGSGVGTTSYDQNNIIANTFTTDLNLQLATRSTVHNNLLPYGNLYTGNTTSLTLSDTLGVLFSTLMSATSLKLTGLFSYNYCSAFTVTGTGITSTCGNAGSSNATTVAPLDILHSLDSGQTFVEFVTSDSNHPGYNSASGVLFANITNWNKFDTPSRFWVDSSRGYCTTGETCYIYDYALSASDTIVLGKSGDLTTSNDAFPTTPTDSCPSEVHGNQVVVDQKTSAQTFLRNAVEIIGDVTGDNDGLCESNEACIYTPNIGAYQGHGDFTTLTCAFQNGTVTGVTMYAYPNNGY